MMNRDTFSSHSCSSPSNQRYIEELKGHHHTTQANPSLSEPMLFLLNEEMGEGRTEILGFNNGLSSGRIQYTLNQPTLSESKIGSQHPGIFIVTQGWYKFRSTHQKHLQTVSAGDIIVRGPESEQTYECFTQQNISVNAVRIDFPENLLRRWLEECSELKSCPGKHAFPSKNAEMIRWNTSSNSLIKLCQQLQLTNISSFCGQLEYESLSLAVLNEFFRSAENTSLSSKSKRDHGYKKALRDAREILHAEWQSPPTISELSRRVGINECYLKSGFKDQYKSTIGRYVRSLKMKQAKILITEEGFTIQQAAFASGFSNPSHFSASFKNEFGTLPSTLKSS